MSSEAPEAVSQVSSPSNIPVLTINHKRLLRFTTSRNPEVENRQLAIVFLVYRESKVLPMDPAAVTTKAKEQFDVDLPPEIAAEVQSKIGAVGRKLVLTMLRELMREGQKTAGESETKVEDGVPKDVAKESEIAEDTVLGWFEESLKVYQNPSLLTSETPKSNDG